MAKQEFCLKWNNHHPTVLSIVDKLFLNEALVDVTLVAEGRSLKVHRLILAACSPYFQEIVDQHPEKTMVIFLRDVKFVELEALVHYMYRGEVKVAQSNLSSLIRTAESLRIKGLAETEDEDCDNPVPYPIVDHCVSDRESPSRKRRRRSGESPPEPLPSTSAQLPQPKLETTDLTPSQDPLMPTLIIPHNAPIQVDSGAHGEYQESKDDLEPCKVLAKVEGLGEEVDLSNNTNAEEDWNDEDYSLLAGDQTENGHDLADPGSSNQQGDEVSFPCPFCSKRYTNKTGLLRHTRTVCLRRATVICEYCNKNYSRKDNLRTHIRRKHPEKLNLLRRADNDQEDSVQTSSSV